MIKTIAWIAAGGAIGAVARFGIVAASAKIGFEFPIGTLAVNLIGSFIVGVTVGSITQIDSFQAIVHPFFVVGILGAFTTFSAFSIETVALLNDQRWLIALVYAVGTTGFCLAAAWVGHRFGQGIT